jgi:hypothetical protein
MQLSRGVLPRLVDLPGGGAGEQPVHESPLYRINIMQPGVALPYNYVSCSDRSTGARPTYCNSTGLRACANLVWQSVSSLNQIGMAPSLVQHITSRARVLPPMGKATTR